MSESRDHLLRSYLVTFASGMQYRFQAEDEAHAREQAEDAEPNETVAGIEREWVIRGEADPLDGEVLYWSNEQGWVDLASADKYPDQTGTLPLGGEWA